MFEQKLDAPVKEKISPVEAGFFSTPDVLTLTWEDLNPDFYTEIEQKLINWTEQSGKLAMVSVKDQPICLGWEVEVQEGQTVIYDWNELSEMGILFAVNAVVCHPKGLAITRDPNTGFSPYLLVDNVDGRWEFGEEDVKEGLDKLIRFGFAIPELSTK